MAAGADRRWIALVLLCATQFMVVLDVSIVNVALPSIQTALDYSQDSLQWVVNAYTLTFAGLLLLGGRMADLLGRRKVFIAGLIVFTAASLACGLAQTEAFLNGARAVQGVGAAIISPAALAIITTTFSEGRERNKALGIWGAIAGIGGAAGVLAGGILTEYLGWEWVFLVNVPVGIAVIALTPFFVSESRVEGLPRVFDIAGAITGTAGLALLVFALVRTETEGWTSAQTLTLLPLAVLLLCAFVLIEWKARSPLMPLRLFRNRSVTGANVVGLLLGAAIFSMFFFLSLYMQQVLGYSALEAGVAYLLVAIVIVLAAGGSQALVTRIGVKTVLAAGMLLLVLGLVWFTQISVDGTYWIALAPGFVLAGVGLGFSFVPVQIAAFQGVPGDLAGAASGVITTSQQVGGALGIAVLATVANEVTGTAPPGQFPAPQALVDGFQAAFIVGVGMALAGLIATLLLIKGGKPDPEALAAPVA